MDINFYLPGEKKYEDIRKKHISGKNVKFQEKFKDQGKQGIVGLMSLKENKDNQCIYKISQSLNYITKHEYTVMKGLYELNSYCPHFCKPYNLIKHKINGNYKKLENPFKISSRHPIDVETILMEYVNYPQLYKLIKNKSFPEHIIISTIKQVLISLAIAQNKKKFSHYDLHSCNILMKKCDKDLVMLYILDDDNQFAIPTNGYIPVIIDFGFSYIEDLDNRPIMSPLAHTNVGFMTNEFDPVADPKLFLVTVSDELKRYRKSKTANILRNNVKNIFKKLDIDWDSGWDLYDSDQVGASDFITERLNEIETDSYIFNNYNNHCIDIIQSLVKLPLSPQYSENIETTYKTFVKEFNKIEKEMRSSLFNIYILRKIVDIARAIKNDYNCDETRENSIRIFKKHTLNEISKIASFCNPKELHYEKLLCSLYVLSECCEGILYDIIDKRMKEKNTQYEKLHVKTCEQIYGCLEINLPDEYVYNLNTKIAVMDASNEKRDNIENLSEEVIKNINKIHPVMRGTFLNDLYNGNLNQEDLTDFEEERSDEEEEESSEEESSEEERSEEERSDEEERSEEETSEEESSEAEETSEAEIELQSFT